MLFIIGLPCLQIIIFCSAIGHDPTGLRLAVANYEQSDVSLCPILPGCNYTMLSCRYLDIIRKKNIVLVSGKLFEKNVILGIFCRQKHR